MKKVLTIAFGICLLSSIAFAGSNVGEIEQIGSQNSATTNQIGTENDSFTGQYGPLNQAETLQKGDKNVSDIVSKGGKNKASVEQHGRNFGKIYQLGTGNDAAIKQGADGAPVSNYYRPAYPGAWIHGAEINQIGGFNDASIEMTQSSNGAKIEQFGMFNKAKQSINTYHTKSTDPDRMGAHIMQDGSANYAAQTTEKSFGMFGIQKIWIKQDGDWNHSTQYAKGGTYSLMEAWILGDENHTTQNLDGFRSHARIDIEGDKNVAVQDQKYTVWSKGGENYADLLVRGDGNYAAQYQLGEYNISTIDIFGSDNSAMTDQVGDLNIADIDVFGCDNVASIFQFGDENMGSILQDGSFNTALMTQIGDLNIGAIMQDGSFNTAVLNQ